MKILVSGLINRETNIAIGNLSMLNTVEADAAACDGIVLCNINDELIQNAKKFGKPFYRLNGLPPQ